MQSRIFENLRTDGNCVDRAAGSRLVADFETTYDHGGDDVEESAKKAPNLKAAFAICLIGLLIGGLYVGMVSPARTVIQADMGIDGTVGIWMINIYTLFYAALIPIIGKVADRRGKKRVFTACICIFCAGAILCGLSQLVGGFALLLVGRVVQAAGAGGMIPVANASIGTTFPPEKRGMALGIAAAVMGVSNVFGAVAGSALVAAFGADNWPVMFYACIPFCIATALGSARVLPDDNAPLKRSTSDVSGSVLFVIFVLLLLLGIKSIDFTDLAGSLANPASWGCLVAAVGVAMGFWQVERRTEDPVFDFRYLSNSAIRITMIVSFFIGCSVISLVLIPELAEFALGMPVGEGGFYVLAIGLTSFVTTPVAGKLIDKVGPKPVLITGLAISIAGLAFLALVSITAPSPAMFVIGLAIVGAGMGMSMGSPTNYMILSNVPKGESTAAIATITLIRQIGTTVAPAIFVGLIASGEGLLGYQHMLLGVAAFNALALITMLFYRQP